VVLKRKSGETGGMTPLSMPVENSPNVGVTPEGWTASGWSFDQLAGVVILELNGTAIARGWLRGAGAAA
jgi:hypothetical protein